MAASKPRLETLEDRLAPAGWPDPTRVTVSFVPGATFAPTDWQAESLRALQAWAAHGDVNLAVVADDGSPLGTAGLSQGDSRFGDVRIAWVPLSSNAVALSVPYAPLAGTSAGDVLLNANANFGPGGYDLFSVVLHEAGHVFGVEHSDNPADAMFEYYNGVRVGPNAADLSALAAVTGTRPPDAFEATAPSYAVAADATARAAVRRHDEDAASPTDRLVVNADLSPADVDVYAYTTTASAPGFTLRLVTRTHSLLSATLTVLDENNNVVGTATADRNGDAVVRVEASSSQPLSFRVASADAAFSAGAYSLELTPDDASALVAYADATNNTPGTATRLTGRAEAGSTQRTFAHDGAVSSGDDDYYRPRLAGATFGALDVWLSAAPGVTVNVVSAGQTLASATANAAGVAHLRLSENVPSRFLLHVSGSGAYFVSATLDEAPQTTLATSGVLDAPQQQTFRGLAVAQTSLLHVEISTETLATVETSVEATLLDASGNVVFTRIAKVGETIAANLFLQPGNYTWRFVAGTIDGSPLAATTFRVRQQLLTDPIGPSLIDPHAPPPPPPPAWWPGGFGYFWRLIDPYGRPLWPFAMPPGP